MSCLIFDATPRAAATPDGGNLIKLLFGNQDVEAMKTSNAVKDSAVYSLQTSNEMFGSHVGE